MAFGIRGGTNYDDYTRWPQRKMPDGRTLYEVPGGGYLFDPTTSAMKGNVVVFRDNKQEYEDARKRQNQAEFNASPAGQMIPIAGTTAGTVGGAVLIHQALKDPAKEVAKDVATQTTSNTAADATADVSASVPTPTGVSAARVPPAGTTAAPGYGQGAVTIPEGGQVPAGYTARATGPNGEIVATPTEIGDAPTDYLGTASRALQGAAGAYQAVEGYKDFRNGNRVGGTVNMAGGAANMASAAGYGTTGAAAGEAGAAGASGYLIPGAQIAAGLYGGYQLAKQQGGSNQRNLKGNLSGAGQGAAAGASVGAGVGSVVPGVGTAIGAGVGAIIGGIGGLVGANTTTTKSKHQQGRDAWRKALQGAGAVDKDWNMSLADGSKFDVGRDGGAMIQNADGKTKRRLTEIDTTDGLSDQQRGKLSAYSNLLANVEGDDAGHYSLGGYYYNAATSNAKDDKTKYDTGVNNLRYFIQQRGWNADTYGKQIDELVKAGKMTADRAAVAKNDFNELMSGAPAAGGAIDAGTRKRWREMRGTGNYGGRGMAQDIAKDLDKKNKK